MEASPDQMAAQEAPQEGGGDPIKPLQDLGTSLSGLLPAMQESGAPPEVLKPLQAAVEAYGQFMSMLTGQGGAQPMAQTSMNEGGNANAAPANY